MVPMASGMAQARHEDAFAEVRAKRIKVTATGLTALRCPRPG